MADGSIVRNNFSVLGNFTLTGIMTLGVITTAGNDRTIQTIGSEADIDLLLLTTGTGTLKTRSGYTADIAEDEDIINFEYHKTKLLSKPASSLLQAPTEDEDQYAIIWDFTSGSFTLVDLGAGVTYENGIWRDGNVVKLGNPLTENTTITGNFELNLGIIADKLSLFNVNADIVGISGFGNNKLSLSGTHSTFLYGGSVNSYINITEVGAIILRDNQSGSGKRGLRGFEDYSANITSLDYPQKGYVDSHLVGKNVSPELLNPTIFQHNFFVKWDNSNNRYALSTIGVQLYTWEEIVNDIVAVGDTGYITNSASLINVTLSDNYINKLVTVVGKGSGGWKVIFSSPVTVNFSDHVVLRSIESTLSTDSIEMLNIATDKWQVIKCVGNLIFKDS